MAADPGSIPNGYTQIIRRFLDTPSQYLLQLFSTITVHQNKQLRQNGCWNAGVLSLEPSSIAGMANLQCMRYEWRIGCLEMARIVDDKKVSYFYSLISVILYFFVLSGIALFLLDQSDFTVVMLMLVYMFLVSNGAHYYNGLQRMNTCVAHPN